MFGGQELLANHTLDVMHVDKNIASTTIGFILREEILLGFGMTYTSKSYAAFAPCKARIRYQLRDATCPYVLCTHEK